MKKLIPEKVGILFGCIEPKSILIEDAIRELIEFKDEGATHVEGDFFHLGNGKFNGYIKIIEERLETDKEYNDRLKDELILRNKTEKQDIEEYLRIQKKYNLPTKTE